jgi:hypothetical protein
MFVYALQFLFPSIGSMWGYWLQGIALGIQIMGLIAGVYISRMEKP